MAAITSDLGGALGERGRWFLGPHPRPVSVLPGPSESGPPAGHGKYSDHRPGGDKT